MIRLENVGSHALDGRLIHLAIPEKWHPSSPGWVLMVCCLDVWIIKTNWLAFGQKLQRWCGKGVQIWVRLLHCSFLCSLTINNWISGGSILIWGNDWFVYCMHHIHIILSRNLCLKFVVHKIWGYCFSRPLFYLFYWIQSGIKHR